MIARPFFLPNRRQRKAVTVNHRTSHSGASARRIRDASLLASSILSVGCTAEVIGPDEAAEAELGQSAYELSTNGGPNRVDCVCKDQELLQFCSDGLNADVTAPGVCHTFCANKTVTLYAGTPDERTEARPSVLLGAKVVPNAVSCRDNVATPIVTDPPPSVDVVGPSVLVDSFSCQCNGQTVQQTDYVASSGTCSTTTTKVTWKGWIPTTTTTTTYAAALTNACSQKCGAAGGKVTACADDAKTVSTTTKVVASSPVPDSFSCVCKATYTLNGEQAPYEFQLCHKQLAPSYDNSRFLEYAQKCVDICAPWGGRETDPSSNSGYKAYGQIRQPMCISLY